MPDCQISCINLSQRGTKHEHITHVGNGRTWRWTVAEVVASIQAKTNTFFVQDAKGNRAEVGVVQATPPYLRTYADGVWSDNLLSLGTCPI